MRPHQDREHPRREIALAVPDYATTPNTNVCTLMNRPGHGAPVVPQLEIQVVPLP